MNDHMNEKVNDEQTTVTLTLEDDTEVECMVLTIFPAGDQEYIALLPMDSVDEDEGEVYLYRYEEDADGNPNLTNIEDDDEYEKVCYVCRRNENLAGKMINAAMGINICVGHDTDAAGLYIRLMIQIPIRIIFRIHHAQYIFQHADIREKFCRYLADIEHKAQIGDSVRINIVFQNQCAAGHIMFFIYIFFRFFFNIFITCVDIIIMPMR